MNALVTTAALMAGLMDKENIRSNAEMLCITSIWNNVHMHNYDSK